jgi:cytochrome c oxidase assembly factor CtaG
MRRVRRGIPPTLAAVIVVCSASPAHAHPLTGGPATGLQIAVLAGGLTLAISGWIMLAWGRARFSKPGYAFMIVGVLAFLVGPDVVGSISDFRAGPLPTTRTRLEVLTPLDGEVIASSALRVAVRLLEPAGASWTPVTEWSPTRGHIHISIDGRMLSMTWEPLLVLPVSAGTHMVTMEYVASDHRPFSPRVLVTRRVTVRPVGADGAGAVLSAAAGKAPPTLSWRDWSWDPTIIVGLALTVLGYRWATRRFPPRRWQPAFFWSGMLSLVLALLSPIDAGSESLFTIHMLQHMLLLLVAPPLIALAVPAALLGRLSQIPWTGRVLHTAWSPLTSLLVFNGVLLFWHLPFAYDATLTSRWIHALEHASFVGAGMVFWGVIVSPVPKLVRASYGLRLGLVVAADVVNFLLGFALAFAGRPFYRHYSEVPRLWGLSPLDDLRLGGAVMWTMGQMMYAIPLLFLLRVVLKHEDGGGSRPGVAAAASDGAGR